MGSDVVVEHPEHQLDRTERRGPALDRGQQRCRRAVAPGPRRDREVEQLGTGAARSRHGEPHRSLPVLSDDQDGAGQCQPGPAAGELALPELRRGQIVTARCRARPDPCGARDLALGRVGGGEDTDGGRHADHGRTAVGVVAAQEWHRALR
jgi:hypothetical protein